MKRKRFFLLIAIFICFLFGLWIYSNTGLNGIYKNYISQTKFSDSHPYWVISGNKIYEIDYTGTKVRSIKKLHGKIIRKNGETYFESPINFELLEVTSSFSKLDIKFPNFVEEYEQITKSTLPEDHLSRVFSPLIKHKIYSAIDNYEEKTIWYKKLINFF